VPKNVQKRKARPKRSIGTDHEDHPVGLWIDKELLRKHQGRTPQTIIHDQSSVTNNRYLELADLALGVNKPKRRVKGGLSSE
jgi:hypothetical protein